MRIPRNRVGYLGWTCIGIPSYVIPPQACNSSPDPGSVNWKKLPMELSPAQPAAAWLSLDLALNDYRSRIYQIARACSQSYDPFVGSFIDLYRHFADKGYAGLLPDNCYEPGDIYLYGYMNPPHIVRSVFAPPNAPLAIAPEEQQVDVVGGIECNPAGQVVVTKVKVVKVRVRE